MGQKYEQLPIEDYLQEILAKQGKATEMYAHKWITGNTALTSIWTFGGTACQMPFLEATTSMSQIRNPFAETAAVSFRIQREISYNSPFSFVKKDGLSRNK